MGCGLSSSRGTSIDTVKRSRNAHVDHKICLYNSSSSKRNELAVRPAKHRAQQGRADHGVCERPIRRRRIR